MHRNGAEWAENNTTTINVVSTRRERRSIGVSTVHTRGSAAQQRVRPTAVSRTNAAVSRFLSFSRPSTLHPAFRF